MQLPTDCISGYLIFEGKNYSETSSWDCMLVSLTVRVHNSGVREQFYLKPQPRSALTGDQSRPWGSLLLGCSTGDESQGSMGREWTAGEAFCLLPVFLCAHIFIARETSGYEAVPGASLLTLEGKS